MRDKLALPHISIRGWHTFLKNKSLFTLLIYQSFAKNKLVKAITIFSQEHFKCSLFFASFHHSMWHLFLANHIQFHDLTWNYISIIKLLILALKIVLKLISTTWMLFIHDALQLIFGSAYQKSFWKCHFFYTFERMLLYPHKLFRGIKLKPLIVVLEGEFSLQILHTKRQIVQLKLPIWFNGKDT